MTDRSQRPRRVLIAPNPFKHCLSGPQVAAALAAGFRQAGWQVDQLPLADGGPGTLDALQAAMGGERRRARVEDALGRRVSASWLKLGPLAIIESAQAIGLERLGVRRLPLSASSEGLGHLLLAAQRAGCREAWVGLGGSASTDGGTGMARPLGWRFLDANGLELPSGGGGLTALARVQRPPQRLRLKIRVLCDVQNPLYGAQGSARVFGPQKGARPAQVLLLEKGLRRLAQLHAAPTARQAGAGAAGGLGYGLMSFAGARLLPGAKALLKLTGFAARLRRADLVVSGEGRLDAQTLQGKLPAQVLAAARQAGKACVLVVGELKGSKGPWKRRGAEEILVLKQGSLSRAQAMERAAELLRDAGLTLATK